METNLFYGEYNGLAYDEVVKDIIQAYETESDCMDEYRIIIASVNSYAYEEDSYFLLLSKTNGKLYEIHASHCSCYGFEGQFEPEETNIPYLLSDKANFGYELVNSRDEIQGFLVGFLRYLKIEEIKERMN